MKSPCSGCVTRGSIPSDRRSRRRTSAPRRTRWIASMVRAGRMPREARGNAWTPGSNYRGRRNVAVTVLPSKRHPWERRIEMYVSPHLKIGTALAEITQCAMRWARDNSEALYEFPAEHSTLQPLPGHPTDRCQDRGVAVTSATPGVRCPTVLVQASCRGRQRLRFPEGTKSLPMRTARPLQSELPSRRRQRTNDWVLAEVHSTVRAELPLDSGISCSSAWPYW